MALTARQTEVLALLAKGCTACVREDGADVVIINRFGKQECEGKGLAYLIERRERVVASNELLDALTHECLRVDADGQVVAPGGHAEHE